MSSWVIVDKQYEKAVLEVFNRKILSNLNTHKYKAVPIMEYLTNLNEKIKQSRLAG